MFAKLSSTIFPNRPPNDGTYWVIAYDPKYRTNTRYGHLWASRKGALRIIEYWNDLNPEQRSLLHAHKPLYLIKVTIKPTLRGTNRNLPSRRYASCP